MKRLFTILIAFISIQCLAQSQDTTGLKIPYTEGKVIYEEVVDLNGINKQQLYYNARQWFIDYFTSSKAVIENEDKEQGRVIGKGTVNTTVSGFSSTTYPTGLTVQIDAKDNKYRYKIYDFVITSPEVDLGRMYGKLRAFDFTPERILEDLAAGRRKTFTKKQARNFLTAFDARIKEMSLSIKKAMLKNNSNDF
ncbi:DUF4468 domain-containing protein [Mucilaginibacter sp. PAMB04274]|uniref:DUF4468 domain-containing protein n=1 Tax=Mucilaginibacter sp. PAMB04274 TaxID=3138568 RepID=UPI0031F628FF